MLLEDASGNYFSSREKLNVMKLGFEIKKKAYTEKETINRVLLNGKVKGGFTVKWNYSCGAFFTWSLVWGCRPVRDYLLATSLKAKN